MKKLYRYLAVAACALMGAGSASAVTGPEKMYLSSDRGADWKNGPTFLAAADNNNDVFEFRGVPFVQGELFLFSDSKFSGWTVNKRFTTEGKNDVNFDMNFSGKFTDGKDGCWKANNAGLYDITLDYAKSTIEITQAASGLTHVCRLYSTITGNPKWQEDIMTCSNGVWEYTGMLSDGQFGIRECNPENGQMTKWMGGACTVNDPDTPVGFSNIENSDKSQNNLSGVYTIIYDPANGTIEFHEAEVIDTGDNILDSHRSAFTTEPEMTDLLLPYWVGVQKPKYVGSSNKYVEIRYRETAGLDETQYGWVKYEDTSNDEDWKKSCGDTYDIEYNETYEHDCKNFNDAYYRCYQYNLEKHPAYSTKVDVSAAGRRMPRAVPEKGSQHTRVARSFAMKDNTTGIEDIVTDGGESVEDTDAPVVWYNLQGQRVSNPSGGIFIRQQGTKVTKEYIR